MSDSSRALNRLCLCLLTPQPPQTHSSPNTHCLTPAISKAHIQPNHKLRVSAVSLCPVLGSLAHTQGSLPVTSWCNTQKSTPILRAAAWLLGLLSPHFHCTLNHSWDLQSITQHQRPRAVDQMDVVLPTKRVQNVSECTEQPFL